MTVLILESNLIWSSRLKKTVASEGHDAHVLGAPTPEWPRADVAIVNLAQPWSNLQDHIQELRQQGTFVIGHAGHKERAALDQGKEWQCDLILTNSMTTFKLPDVLKKLESGSLATIRSEFGDE